MAQKTTSKGLHYDYYWRDYMGKIPNDAVEGGHAANNTITYIGQVYVHQFGVCPVTIYPGIPYAKPSITGFDVWNFVKILCSSSKERFKWIPADSKSLHVRMIGKHMVRGGVEHGGKVTNIGRILYRGDVIVAKVCGSEIGDARLYYLDDNGKEQSVDTYEILIYDTEKKTAVEQWYEPY